MTIPEIAAQIRMVLGVCAKANANVSPAERIYFAAAQNNCSDEEIISFWLAVSSLEEHQVPMFVAKHWAERASNFIEWIAVLENNTGSAGYNLDPNFFGVRLRRANRRGTIPGGTEIE